MDIFIKNTDTEEEEGVDEKQKDPVDSLIYKILNIKPEKFRETANDILKELDINKTNKTDGEKKVEGNSISNTSKFLCKMFNIDEEKLEENAKGFNNLIRELGLEKNKNDNKNLKSETKGEEKEQNSQQMNKKSKCQETKKIKKKKSQKNHDKSCKNSKTQQNVGNCLQLNEYNKCADGNCAICQFCKPEFLVSPNDASFENTKYNQIDDLVSTYKIYHSTLENLQKKVDSLLPHQKKEFYSKFHGIHNADNEKLVKTVYNLQKEIDNLKAHQEKLIVENEYSTNEIEILKDEINVLRKKALKMKSEEDSYSLEDEN